MKVAFVTPRYGLEILGGAEFGARMLAEHLAALGGDEVSVLTTTALDAATWSPGYPEGEAELNGVRIHRFANQQRHPEFLTLSDQLLKAPVNVMPWQAAEWVDQQGPTSPALIDAIARSEADVLVFYPYLYHPTVAGVPVAQGRAVVHPAAHDEAPLYLPVFRELFASADALVFQTEAERSIVSAVAEIRHVPHLMLGLGTDPPPPDAAAPEHVRRARERVDGLGDRPFLLCLGRVDDGKGTRLLASLFTAYKRRHPGPLALVFAGPVVHPPDAHPDVLVAGPVDEDVKWSLLADCQVFVQPSPYEAFSIVLMEAWSMGRPIMVNAACGATREHAERSAGGTWFAGYGDFEAQLDTLLADPELRARLGAAGAAYVEANFHWPALIARYHRFLAGVAARH